MTIHRFGVVVAAGVFAWGLAPQAQSARTLDVSFHKGLVTIEATNVTVREILLEWGRKGGSRIINADKLAGPVIPFVEFKAEPEVVVLRSLLRDVPGYGAAPRLTTADDISTIEAVFILATRSVPVSNAPAAGVPQLQQSPQPQQLMPQGPPQSAPQPVQGSVDSEIPPVRPMQGELPPTTPGSATPNPNLRTGPGGTVTSTIPGVVIPGPATPPAGGATPPPAGRGRGGGGGGGVPSV